jgi:predicted transcriptional regulator
MQFEIAVSRNLPLTNVDNPDEAMESFLLQIGYLPRGMESKRGTKVLRESIPYRLFADCLARRPEKPWTPDELSKRLSTSKVTVYRHIGKLRSMDLIEDVATGEGRGKKRGIRMRYGSLAKAWNFVEANVGIAMENYRKSVEHIDSLIKQERRK